jgi:CBS domain-containing protein
MKVRDVMTTAVTTLRSDTFGVVSEADLDEGRIVGIVTRRDVLRLVAHRQLLSEQAWTARTAMASNDRG